MEFVGQPRPSGACNFLGVPGPSSLDLDDDEGEVVIGIRPKSSPLPRRRSSDTDEDSEPEPPLSGSRRVSFADAKGLSLVQVKEFDNWDVPKLPRYDSSEGKAAEEYFLSPLTFSLPLSTEELFVKVREQKVELETIDLLPGTTILKGTIRVLNISFTKAVYVRTTLDTWSSHFDLLAEYIPSSSEDLMDCFSFKLTLVPPFGEQGARVDFCLRYETPVGTFWANNNNRNYVLFCHLREREKKEKPQKEILNKKSCLKIVGQNFSTVENLSAVEASSQENISTDVLKNGQKVDTISDGQSGTSEDGQNLPTESRQNSSRRSRRKVARMARARDYFAQRYGGANDTERDELPPDAKQRPQEENQPDLQSFSERSSKSEGSQFALSLETCSESLLNVLHDTSPAQDYTSNGEPEKPESINLADSATLTGGDSATDIPDNPLHSNDESAPADRQNINKSVSKAEESSQKQGRSYECTRSMAAESAESADSVISAVNSKSLVSQTNSFTFGTVVAPLYHQVFGRVGSESQSLGDWGNPVKAALNVGDLAHTEKRETVPTDARGNNDKVQENVIETQESNQECLDATLNSPPTDDEEETSLSVTANAILDHAETPVEMKDSDQRSEVPKPNSGATIGHPHTVNILNADLLNPQILTESSHLQGEAQEDNLTHDLQSQTTVETARAQLPEHTRTQSETDLDETLEVMTTLVTSFMSLQPSQSVSERINDQTDQQTSGSGANDCKCVDESNKDNDVGKTVTSSTSNGVSEEDELSEALYGLNPNHANNSAPKEPENSSASCFGTVEERDVTTPQVSPEETNNVEEGNKVVVNSSHRDETKHSAEIKVIGEVAESMTKAVMGNYGGMFLDLKDEDTLKDEAVLVSETIEHREMEAAASKQEDFCLTDTTEAQNWEMMVEEEEKSILTNEEEGIEAVEEDQEEQLEDAGMETASENRDTTEKEKEETEEEVVGEIMAAREKDNTAEDADVLEDKQRIGGNEIWEIVARKEVERELVFVKATKTVEEEGLAEEAEVKKREEQKETELEREQRVAEVQEVINVQEEEKIEGKEEMAIDLNDDDEADVEWEDQVKPREESIEEENPDYKEEILVDESESMAIEDRGNEVGCFEERLDITQNKVEDGLSALVINVQDERVTDKGDTGERQNAHIPTEMHLYKEEGFQSNDIVAHDLSEAAGEENEFAAAEGGSCLFADEPESDQTSHGSSSAESDSDDEVELYMHCLRAVHTGAQAYKARDKDTGYSVGKRPSVSRSKLLSTPMPSISESQDEEQHLSRLQDNHEDTETAPTAAALPASSGQESINRNSSWWNETFSCSNVSKTLLYATLLAVFLVVAYHYDFLACFGLYLISVVWLYCQGERQPVKRTTKE